ncbi:hypothetical protein AB835_14820 [Candidatus Endobugula sertula]|uniref:Major facilitator superfamily (MFS) profile domain-containing protein n=1 Tax=Candidatus Endobugula sertula TaxID=62101 RepID=A0A1D2QL85_9GAMM|nr:hypothetical protein AB835_14820 [Candidatus Endobugula sertula]
MPLSVYLYSFCQAINLTSAVISVAVAATVGNILAPNELWATIPYGMQFFLLLLSTYPAALLMKRFGRKAGFSVGCSILMLSGIVGYLAIQHESFMLLVISHSLLGCFTAFANFYRFAATDNLPKGKRSKALSLVIAGGVLAGVFGPYISSQLREVSGYPLFSLCYAFFIVLAIINILVIFFLPTTQKTTSDKTMAQPKQEPLNQNTRSQIIIALISAAIGYGLMNLLMIQSSLHMGHMHVSFEKSSFAIQWHVVSMFFPSFFSGLLIARWGHFNLIYVGFLLLIATFLVNMFAHNYAAIAFSLILLGLGWNFCYVGGSALLSVALENNPKAHNWQGIGDTTIAIFATMGAFLPSVLLTLIGWQGSNILALSLCLLSIFLVSHLSPKKIVQKVA